ncbi:unnamed protein product [Moneuplotes crassus]|uniref:Uncharacterized protein n=1 Tax=Euplotes crassus TaxID=5936 RepID=A0AAD2D4K5_EUPCR|nr:unnamed protein product [Moneuplotes crassus]
MIKDIASISEFKKRNIQAECSSQSEFNIGLEDFERKLMRVRNYGSCNINDAHLGAGGDIYISGYGNSISGEFFFLRTDEDFNVQWMRSDGSTKLFISVDPLERRVFAAENSGSSCDLEEIDAATGDQYFESRAGNGAVSQNYVGMTFEPGTNTPIYITSNSLGSTVDIYAKNIGKSTAHTHNFPSSKRVGKIAYVSTGNILVHHMETSTKKCYLSLLTLNQPIPNTSFRHITEYECPYGHTCTANFERSSILVDPDNSLEGFALLELVDTDDLVAYFIFVQVDLENERVLQHYVATNATSVIIGVGGTIETMYSMRVFQGNVYFLAGVKDSSGNIGNSLLLFNTSSTPGSFESLHQCSSDDGATTQCQSQYSTTNTFISNGGLLTQMIIKSGTIIFFGSYDSSCVRIKSQLTSLATTQDWYNSPSVTKFFTDLKPISIFGTTVTENQTIVHNDYNSWTGAKTWTTSSNKESSIIDQSQSFYVETHISLEIDKGQEEKKNISIACDQYDIFRFKYSIANANDDEVYDILKIDSSSGELDINSTDFGTKDRNFTLDIKISSPYLQNDITIPAELNEVHLFGKTLETQQRVTNGVLGASIAIGSISAFSPSSGFSGLWMLINQYQLLMLLTMVGTEIHPDVRKIIYSSKFLTLNLEEVDIKSSLRISQFLEKMKRNQTNQGLDELGFGSISTFQTNINLFLLFILILMIYLICVFWCCLFRKCLKLKAKRCHKRKEAKRNQNNEGHNNNGVRSNNKGLTESVNSTENNYKENYCHIFCACCCKCFCKCLCKWMCKCCCKKVNKWCRGITKYAKEWQHKYFPHRFFMGICMRIMIETLFIISATSCNELSIFDDTDYYSSLSINIAAMLLVLCIVFILFLFCYYFKHRNTKISDKNNESGIYFEELFSELKPGKGRIYIPILILRIFIFVCIVFLLPFSPESKLGIIFVLQFLYWLQTVGIRKFTSGSQSFINIMNEFTFLIIIFIFAMWNKRDNWKETNSPTMKEVVMYIIFCNTFLMVIIQTGALLHKIYKWYKEYYPSDEDLWKAREIAGCNDESSHESKNSKGVISLNSSYSRSKSLDSKYFNITTFMKKRKIIPINVN